VIKYKKDIQVADTFIQFHNVSFRFPEQSIKSPDILRDIDLSIECGEYIAIVGSNGSGKSTLVKLIDGLLIPSKGKVEIDGFSTSIPAHLPKIRKQIGIIFQYPEDQIVASTVEEDIAFGLENYGVPTREMHRRVKKVMEGFDLMDVRQRPSYMLSGGQTQRLALASVLAIAPECLIFDEATSMLDPAARKNLMGIMKSFHREGKTILHITHSMDEADQADRILVMGNGEIQYDGKPDQLFRRDDIEQWNLEYPENIRLIKALNQAGILIPDSKLSLSELAASILRQCYIRPNDSGGNNPIGTQAKKPMVDVKDLSFVYLMGTPMQVQALNGVSFEVKSGNGHGLIGKTGSGKSTVLQHLNGILKPQSGSVRVGNFDLTNDEYQLKDVVSTAGLVMQNPENQFFEFYVGDEIAFGPKNTGYDGKLANRVQWAMEQVGLDFLEFKDKPVHTLSGGQKRKVALASILALKPSIFMLDEPTAGLDPHSRREVLASFHRLKQDGVTMIISSHNLDDILSLTDTLTVLDKGHSVDNGETHQMISDVNSMLNHGIDPPFIAKLAMQISKENDQRIEGIADIKDLVDRLGPANHGSL